MIHQFMNERSAFATLSTKKRELIRIISTKMSLMDLYKETGAFNADEKCAPSRQREMWLANTLW